jgi:hypothetical protein
MIRLPKAPLAALFFALLAGPALAQAAPQTELDLAQLQLTKLHTLYDETERDGYLLRQVVIPRRETEWGTYSKALADDLSQREKDWAEYSKALWSAAPDHPVPSK